MNKVMDNRMTPPPKPFSLPSRSMRKGGGGGGEGGVWKNFCNATNILDHYTRHMCASNKTKSRCMSCNITFTSWITEYMEDNYPIALQRNILTELFWNYFKYSSE